MGNIRYKGGNYTRDARSSYVVVEPLSITENGTYTAPDGTAYSPVSVNVGGGGGNNAKIREFQGDFSFSADLFEVVEIPEGYNGFYFSAEYTSIRYAKHMKKLVIPSTMTSIRSNLFVNCTLLEQIIINKPEGSITGAPWGAPESCEVIWNG